MKTIYHSQNIIKAGMAVAAFAVSPIFCVGQPKH